VLLQRLWSGSWPGRSLFGRRLAAAPELSLDPFQPPVALAGESLPPSRGRRHITRQANRGLALEDGAASSVARSSPSGAPADLAPLEGLHRPARHRMQAPALAARDSAPSPASGPGPCYGGPPLRWTPSADPEYMALSSPATAFLPQLPGAMPLLAVNLAEASARFGVGGFDCWLALHPMRTPPPLLSTVSPTASVVLPPKGEQVASSVAVARRVPALSDTKLWGASHEEQPQACPVEFPDRDILGIALRGGAQPGGAARRVAVAAVARSPASSSPLGPGGSADGLAPGTADSSAGEAASAASPAARRSELELARLYCHPPGAYPLFQSRRVVAGSSDPTAMARDGAVVLLGGAGGASQAASPVHTAPACLPSEGGPLEAQLLGAGWDAAAARRLGSGGGLAASEPASSHAGLGPLEALLIAHCSTRSRVAGAARPPPPPPGGALGKQGCVRVAACLVSTRSVRRGVFPGSWSVVHRAAATGIVGLAKAVTSGGAAAAHTLYSRTTDGSRMTPFDVACRFRRPHVLQQLLSSAHASFVPSDGTGATGLHHAVAGGSARCVDSMARHMLARERSRQRVTRDFLTRRDGALCVEDAEKFRSPLEVLEARDASGRTPLALACCVRRRFWDAVDAAGLAPERLQSHAHKLMASHTAQAAFDAERKRRLAGSTSPAASSAEGESGHSAGDAALAPAEHAQWTSRLAAGGKRGSEAPSGGAGLREDIPAPAALQLDPSEHPLAWWDISAVSAATSDACTDAREAMDRGLRAFPAAISVEHAAVRSRAVARLRRLDLLARALDADAATAEAGLRAMRSAFVPSGAASSREAHAEALLCGGSGALAASGAGAPAVIPQRAALAASAAPDADSSADSPEPIFRDVAPPSRPAGVVACLLLAGADPSARDNKGCTPLMLACAAGNADAALALLSCRRLDRVSGRYEFVAQPRAVNVAGDTALSLLCSQPAVLPPARVAASAHARQTADSDSAAAAGGLPCVAFAARVAARRQAALCAAAKGLVRAGCPISRATLLGETALHCAAGRGHAALVEALLEAGAAGSHAALRATDASGATPLEAALRGERAGVPGCGECRAALDAAMKELAAARAGADSPPSGARADADATDDSDSGAEAGDSDYEYIDGDEVCE